MMRYSILSLFLAWLNYYGYQTVMCYKIPQVKLELLENGFRVSIPHESGVENVAFNINRNRPFKAFEPGEFSDRIRTPASDNRWSYESRRRLQDDDVIYIWTDVQHYKMRYRSMSPPIKVREALNGGSIDELNENNPTYDNNDTTTTTMESFEIDPRYDNCEESVTIMSNRLVQCKGQLIFEDNFDGTALDMSRWRYEVRLPLDTADAEFVLYDTNAELSNGLLKIEPHLWGNDRPDADIRRGELNLGARCTAYQNSEMECQRHPFGRVVLPPVVTARINTKHAFSFKYGRIEVRAKLPKGDWLFPLLLLEPLVNYYGQHPYASGQMRVAFQRSNVNLETNNGANIGGRVIHGGAVLRLESRYRDIFMVNTNRDAHFGDTFHTYSLTWSERSLSLDVDNKNYGIVNVLHHTRCSRWRPWRFPGCMRLEALDEYLTKSCTTILA
ncbi:gram-negative bacteria-binding protein 1-like isoform X3 [Eurosta solidaginis]|uniref:gram-negative bacteria-binding protein 1-like isoform X3 n=1 Tax=Eurosta solidaginis TaxID=178769 RepID=UPI003530FB3E